MLRCTGLAGLVLGLATAAGCDGGGGPAFRAVVPSPAARGLPVFDDPVLKEYSARFEADRERYRADPAAFFPGLAGARPCDVPYEAMETLLGTAQGASEIKLEYGVLQGNCAGGVLEGDATVVGAVRGTKQTVEILLVGSFERTKIAGAFQRYKRISASDGDDAGTMVVFYYGEISGSDLRGPVVFFTFPAMRDGEVWVAVEEDAGPGLVRLTEYTGPEQQSVSCYRRAAGVLIGGYGERLADGSACEARVDVATSLQPAAAPPGTPAPATPQPSAEAALPTTPGAATGSPPSPPAPATPEDPATRLKKLKDLLDQGLIDKATYEKKKKEILDAL